MQQLPLYKLEKNEKENLTNNTNIINNTIDIYRN